MHHFTAWHLIHIKHLEAWSCEHVLSPPHSITRPNTHVRFLSILDLHSYRPCALGLPIYSTSTPQLHEATAHPPTWRPPAAGSHHRGYKLLLLQLLHRRVHQSGGRAHLLRRPHL